MTSLPRRHPVLFGLLVSALTIVLVIVTMNFMTGEKQIERRIERLYALDDQRFAYELGSLLGPPFTEGNSHQTLVNGDEIFPSMLAAIREARTSITFETYIYWSGDIGQQFADALAERSKSGISTHVLLDWVGSAKMDEKLLDQMKDAGVQINRYHPPSWTHLGRLNNRTHRKLLVVDGRIGFTGGVGVAPTWTGNAQDPDHWRDTHFKVEGPVVAQMQAVFLDNWTKTTGEVLHGDKYFPDLHQAGKARMQMFSSSPSGGSDSMQLMYLLAISSASHTIDLSAAYFVPDDLTLRALVDALKRGVKVRVVVPGKYIDSNAVQGASRAMWGPLLANGALIAEYGPTMFHCKIMIVDGLLTSVGSTNFDNRSFRLNDEATLNVIDREFAATQTRLFEADLAKSDPISLDEWRERPLKERLKEKMSSVIESQL